jgi:hypothetical protein
MLHLDARVWLVDFGGSKIDAKSRGFYFQAFELFSLSPQIEMGRKHKRFENSPYMRA